MTESGYENFHLTPSQIAIGTNIPYSGVKKCLVILRDNGFVSRHDEFSGLYNTSVEQVQEYTEGLANYRRTYKNQFGTFYKKPMLIKTK